ncbi:DUF192 domain-containing protein [Azospirillum picis]|uniref:Uncharacterized membrane protein (UPF0127 family) n=1 Tax=Azospirillum picis TaxID=488438 RepID=A0ABU0MV30_9PROT|nr:DUF192 domain-containing protein [Azospirillum picis]MBP2303457.1 uncharacterized membrane protein (UPF0127 family) [Azospirillum picis]MDQ0537354.1 uncharacterized membrane protein (UPF0127 family) [Azospirillum picis]
MVVTLLLLVAAVPAAALESFQKSKLTIETAGGGKFRFDVELALTQQQQAQGLMFRQSMPADAGMLFVYDRTQQASFWMKNTLIPLDMLFIAADGRIVNIHERAVPGSLDSVNSDGPVKAILELNGGMAARLGVHPGDRVVSPDIAK